MIPHFPFVDCWLFLYTAKIMIRLAQSFFVLRLKVCVSQLSLCVSAVLWGHSANRALNEKFKRKQVYFQKCQLHQQQQNIKTDSGMVAPSHHVCQVTDVRFHRFENRPSASDETVWKTKQQGAHHLSSVQGTRAHHECLCLVSSVSSCRGW